MIARLRRASTAIFLVHVVRTALACIAVAPLWSLLGTQPASAVEHGLRDDALFAALLLNQLPNALPFTLAALAAHALVAPYLHQLVLGCMEGLALGSSSRRAATAYPKALLLSAVRVALLAVAFGVFALLVLRVSRTEASAHTAIAVVALVGVLAGIAIATAHDLWAVHLNRHAANQRGRSASWRAFSLPRPRTLAAHALAILAAATIALGSELLARSALFLLAPSMLLLALQQSLALLATLVRAAWLAASLDLAPRAAASASAPAPQAAEI